MGQNTPDAAMLVESNLSGCSVKTHAPLTSAARLASLVLQSPARLLMRLRCTPVAVAAAGGVGCGAVRVVWSRRLRNLTPASTGPHCTTRSHLLRPYVSSLVSTGSSGRKISTPTQTSDASCLPTSSLLNLPPPAAHRRKKLFPHCGEQNPYWSDGTASREDPGIPGCDGRAHTMSTLVTFPTKRCNPHAQWRSLVTMTTLTVDPGAVNKRTSPELSVERRLQHQPHRQDELNKFKGQVLASETCPRGVGCLKQQLPQTRPADSDHDSSELVPRSRVVHLAPVPPAYPPSSDDDTRSTRDFRNSFISSDTSLASLPPSASIRRLAPVTGNRNQTRALVYTRNVSLQPPPHKRRRTER
ncbi:hypothetical protein C0Q70_16727 [Pomacea canaliculata]|uniref:Uncharacterized protein n=1 Tax=Pomacea canaliculata TaxID=400727 RepID=A0A2T7NQK7_POMCA|nr:hypothetical protein C0Q70_16727 [Pomacea canaliculata]